MLQSAFQQDGLAPAKADVGRCQVLQAFVIAAVIVVIDEVRDLGFKIAGQVIVLKQNAILEGLVPALDLALCLRMARRAANVRYAAILGRVLACGMSRGDIVFRPLLTRRSPAAKIPFQTRRGKKVQGDLSKVSAAMI